MIASVAPGIGSIVSVAGPAMMIGFTNCFDGFRSAAARTPALSGVGVGLGIGIGVGVDVGVEVGVAVGDAVGVGVDVGVGEGGIVAVGVGLGGGRPASMTQRPLPLSLS